MSETRGEKKEMQGLNSKLAVYIERMRQRELGSSGGVTYEEISSIIDMFERNVADLRGSLDESDKENTRLKIEIGKYKSQADSRDELKRRISKLEKELAAAREKIQDLEATLSFQTEEKRILRGDLETRLEKLNRQLLFKDQDLKEVREVSTPIPDNDLFVDDKSKPTSLKAISRCIDKLEWINENQQLKKLLAGHSVDINSISAQIRLEYEEKLENLRQSMREQHKVELDKLRSTLESQFSSEKSRLVVRIKELEMQLEKERDIHQKQMRVLKGDRDTLEREIAEYRKLLESEEYRLNVDLTPRTRSKRRRVLESAAARSKRRREAVFDTISSSNSTGLVSIIEADPEGDFIKLQNNADKDQLMGGWQLQRVVDDGDQLSYKFPSKFVLSKDKDVTIWAAGAGHSHNPPTHIVYKHEESWGNGDNMQTTLVDVSGEVMATRVVQRENTANYEELEPFEDVESGGLEETDGEEGSRCQIM